MAPGKTPDEKAAAENLPPSNFYAQTCMDRLNPGDQEFAVIPVSGGLQGGRRSGVGEHVGHLPKAGQPVFEGTAEFLGVA